MILEQRPGFPSRRKALTSLHGHELHLCHVIPVSKQISVMAVQSEAVINSHAHVSWCGRIDAVLTGWAPLSLSLPRLFLP